MEKKKSELMVMTKAKDLCSYVLTVTQKSPKQFQQIAMGNGGIELGITG